MLGPLAYNPGLLWIARPAFPGGASSYVGQPSSNVWRNQFCLIG